MNQVKAMKKRIISDSGKRNEEKESGVTGREGGEGPFRDDV